MDGHGKELCCEGGELVPCCLHLFRDCRGGAGLVVLPLGLGLSVGAAPSGTGQDARSVAHRHDPTATLGFGSWGSCFGGEMGIEKLLDQPQHHPLPGEVLAGRVLCSTRTGVISVSCALNLPRLCFFPFNPHFSRQFPSLSLLKKPQTS